MLSYIEIQWPSSTIHVWGDGPSSPHAGTRAREPESIMLMQLQKMCSGDACEVFLVVDVGTACGVAPTGTLQAWSMRTKEPATPEQAKEVLCEVPRRGLGNRTLAVWPAASGWRSAIVADAKWTRRIDVEAAAAPQAPRPAPRPAPRRRRAIAPKRARPAAFFLINRSSRAAAEALLHKNGVAYQEQRIPHGLTVEREDPKTLVGIVQMLLPHSKFCMVEVPIRMMESGVDEMFAQIDPGTTSEQQFLEDENGNVHMWRLTWKKLNAFFDLAY